MSLDCPAGRSPIFCRPVPTKPFRAGGPARIFISTPSRERRESIGSVVFMDELIGDRRIKVTCELVDLVPGRTLVWQLRRPLFRLPVRLILQLKDDDTGVDDRAIDRGRLLRSWLASRSRVPAILSGALCCRQGRACADRIPQIAGLPSPMPRRAAPSLEA